jgi:hypothetical protein
MSFYLAEWGGAASDRAYKDAGSLTIIGPFPTEDDAWDFWGVINEIREYSAPTDFALLKGHLEDTEKTATAQSPEERLRDRFDLWDLDLTDPDEIPEENLAILNRWWPTFRQEWSEEEQRCLEESQRHKAECAANGHQWNDWYPLFTHEMLQRRNCKHCWLQEEEPANAENRARIEKSLHPEYEERIVRVRSRR